MGEEVSILLASSLLSGPYRKDRQMGSKRYIGDGVYANYDGQQLILTTENGMETTNTIYLEHSVMEALHKYIQNLELGKKQG